MMRRAAGVLVAAIAAGVLAACGPAPRTLDGVEIAVDQPRTDIAAGRLVLRVENGSDAGLEVVGARLTSPGFLADVVWAGDGTTIAAGRTIDLRVESPVFACEQPATAEVVLEYRDGAATRTSRFAPDDPTDLLGRLRAAHCLEARVAEIVAVAPREVRIVDGIALLAFEVTPTGAPGTVVLDAVDGTPLLQPAVDGVAVRDVLPLGLELSATGPRGFEIPLVPNRCDAHALADDKVGTIIPFLVTTGDEHAARWTVAAPDDVKGDLTAYYASACGLASS